MQQDDTHCRADHDTTEIQFPRSKFFPYGQKVGGEEPHQQKKSDDSGLHSGLQIFAMGMLEIFRMSEHLKKSGIPGSRKEYGKSARTGSQNRPEDGTRLRDDRCCSLPSPYPEPVGVQKRLNAMGHQQQNECDGQYNAHGRDEAIPFEAVGMENKTKNEYRTEDTQKSSLAFGKTEAEV